MQRRSRRKQCGLFCCVANDEATLLVIFQFAFGQLGLGTTSFYLGYEIEETSYLAPSSGYHLGHIGLTADFHGGYLFTLKYEKRGLQSLEGGRKEL
jgi:hypothetical protein